MIQPLLEPVEHVESTDASAPSHQRRKAERPDELLDAALSLFVEKGYAATRIDEVARRAGVSKGTLYLYYASKEELLKEVIRSRLSTPIAEAIETVAAHTGSTAELLTEVVAPWWAGVIGSDASGVFKLIITEVRNFPEIAEFYNREVVEPGHRVMEQVIRRGIGRGEFREVDVAAAVHSLLLPMIMLCVHRHSLGACEAAASIGEPLTFIKAHFELLLRGLRQMQPDVAAVPTAAS
ncbi:TetR/AcrR family transcriptional regulator [Leptothrix discophora]|uniref:TetR/AcrR family transcriptional regulator n=1 Tax=Leptothrix discophora TaxID=89 RepID=A0ABT9G234_LEPDI|nr:TetR/AcrR family transcriptional regulator [Leptothrix discophora]MDP4300480.1 TetR/AcrR family transcriptional regulator [Leptothrix discophora]